MWKFGGMVIKILKIPFLETVKNMKGYFVLTE